MKLIKHGRNVHELNFDSTDVKIAFLSDVHWDNPKCDQNLLKRHLDYCLKEGIKVFLNGDTFCLMQGRGDNRRNKSDIRPEHNNARYLDSVIETAVEWFTPYADIITVIGYGNHETGIIKYQETDVLRRFVDLLNYKCKTNIQTGGYGGWIVIKNGTRVKTTTKVKYYHGSGCGGLVTKGALNLTRAMEMYEDFDVFTMGHIHENISRNDVRENLTHNSNNGYYSNQKDLHMMITGTYKEEYGDGDHGWHVERGAPPKPLGGRILTIKQIRVQNELGDKVHNRIDSYKFPI